LISGGNVRVFKTKWFVRFTRKEKIEDAKLVAAIRETENGLHDGELGGNLIKKRISRVGAGKRGGYRTIIVYSTGSRAFFVYGFPKNVEDNIDDTELREYRKIAQIFLGFKDVDIRTALRVGELKEVHYNEKVSK
jgi:hypothetical protein